MSIERAKANPPRVVIIGAGSGGLAAAKRLEKHDLDITVVDRNNYHTFLPSCSYQVATAGLNAADVGYPVRVLQGATGLVPTPAHGRQLEYQDGAARR